MTPRFIRTPTGIIRYDNNFTDIEKIKLENIENGAQVNTILGIKGSNEDNFRIGYIIITKDNIGLGSVDNTPDNEKNVLSATKLTTGRNITIGNQTVNFDGSKNIEYSLSKIGAVNKAGDTITGDIILSDGAGLTVDGAVLLKSTLSVDEKTMLKDILEVSGATTLKDTLAVTGNTTIGGTISVTGNSTLSNLSITGNNTIGGTLEVTGKTTLNNELVSNGATTLKDTLAVTGNTTIGGTISVTGNSTLNGTLTVVGGSSLSTLTTSGLATLNELNVTKGANILGNAAISGGLSVKGNSSFSTISTSGKATLNSLEVVGALSIGSDLSISGALTVAGKTTLNGYTTINNRLEVSDNITATSLTINAEDFGPLIPAVVINGNLSVTKVGAETVSAHKVIADESFELSMGEANFIGNVNIDGITDINTLQVSESAEFNCGVDMYGIVTIEGALKVNAGADLKNLNVTNETIVNTLKVNSTAVVDGEYLKVRGNLIIESGDASIDYNLTVGQTIKTKNLTVSNVLTSNNVIALATNKYTDQYNYGAMDAGNSNIYNVNQIQFGDLCENAAEGIQFYNTSTTVDSLWAKSGVLYFTPNRTWGNAGTDTIVLTSSNYKKYVTTESHTHYSISTKSDDRNVDTKPNDYNNKIVFSGLKSTSKIGYPSTPTGYAYVVGLRGWDDNSGGYAWEVGFSNSGIFVRNGATTSWNPWYRIYTSADKPTKADIGLGNVDNTADSTKSVKYATSAGSANAVTWNNVTSKPSTFTPASHTHDHLTIYGNRPTSADFAPGTNGAGSMFHFIASSNMTTGKPPQEGNILQMNWDYTNGYDTQLALSNDNPIADMYIRNQRNGTWGSWSTVLSSSNYTKYAAAKNHTHTKSQITDFPASLPANGGTSTYANYMNGTYTGNGGAQAPSYVPSGKVRFNMMNQLKGLSQLPTYADFILMDTYTGSDVPYVTAIGVLKRGGTPRAYIATGKKGNTTTWEQQVELITSGNIGTQTVATATKATGVVDYAASNKTIQIGYGGAGISGDDIKYIAGYTKGDNNDVDAKIKDVSKDALKSWLGLDYFTTTESTNVGLEISQNVIGYISGLSSNPAGDSAKDGALIGQRFNDNWKAEIYLDYDTGHMATRGKKNGTWHPWQVQLDSGNYTKYAAAKDHTHNYISSSDGTIKLYCENSTEINFGGTNASNIIYFGRRSKDVKTPINVFYFGNQATITNSDGNEFTIGSATIYCNSISGYDCKFKYIRVGGKLIESNSIAWRHADTRTAVDDLCYTDDTESSKWAPTISTLAYWNGRYNTYNSNLRYCWGGQMTYSPDGAITCFRAGSSYLEVTANGVAYGCSWWQSDTKLKTNIEETNVNDALTKLSSIDFIQYDWKESYIKDKPHIKLGLSANQVETIIPEAVMNIEQPEENEYDVIKQLDSTVLITYSMKAIVELNNKLNDKVEKLEKRIKELETAKN